MPTPRVCQCAHQQSEKSVGLSPSSSTSGAWHWFRNTTCSKNQRKYLRRNFIILLLYYTRNRRAHEELLKVPEAKVCDLRHHGPGVDQHVRELKVPVHDSAAAAALLAVVQGGHALGDSWVTKININDSWKMMEVKMETTKHVV